jgi:hydrophobe/amphiphile efflux-1 (HAE1) family protein
MNLIEISLRRPVFAWVLMFALIVFGAISLNRLGISQMPDVDFPVLTISVNYPGAAPEVVETDIVNEIEARLLNIEGIKEMRASALQGSGSITLEFDINRNIDVALQEVQTALSQFRLPQGVEPPLIFKQNPEEEPIMRVAISGGKDLKAMIGWVDTFLLDQLRFLPGVSEVSIAGFSERNLRIWLDPSRLKALDLTISDVLEALRTQHLESAAGQFTEGKRELRVRWLGEAAEVKELGAIRILRRGGQIIHNRVIRISDVARVEDGLSDIRRLARVDGETSIGIGIRKQRGTNEVEVAASVRKKLDQLKDRFPPGYKHQVIVDFTKNTESTVNLTKEKLVVAAIITILVCFLFLGNLPAALNILFSIPTSIVGTFTILYFSGFTLNLFTLLALTLAVSIVVDDAIMLLENIVRHYRMGKSPFKASLEGSMEVLPAAIAATLAVIAVFLPVIFMSGVIGKFFFQFGVTMSAAVLLSLLEAVTITPMRAAAFLSGRPKISRFEQFLDDSFHRLAATYGKSLAWAIRWRWPVVTVSLLLFAVSLFLVKKIKQEFVPAQDQNLIIAVGQTPPGSSLEVTDQASRAIEAVVQKDPAIADYFVSVGAGGPSASVNSVFMALTLKPREERSENHIQVMDRLRSGFREVKGIRMVMRDTSSRNLTTGRLNPVAMNLRGPDLTVLQGKAKEIMERLESEKLAVDMDTDFKLGLPELLITPDRDAMAARGVSVENVGQVLSAAVGGLRQGRYTADGRRYDIRFKLPDNEIRSAADINKIYVRNIAGNLVSLRELVKIKEQPAAQSINRINRQRAVAIFGNLAPGQSQAVVLGRTEAIAKEVLPPGYAYAFEGAAAGLSDSSRNLITALLIGILVAYLILAVQFNSFVHPVAVLMALPFSLSGALVALWLAGASLNLFSYIGLIVLMGIAKKNSIMLVEFTNQIRALKGSKIDAALLEACPVRLRPVLMTSIATVAAALPLVVGTGMGHETRTPMGLAIIGGTIVSTLLTLYVVPAIYLLLCKLERHPPGHHEFQ